jgi:molybdopterin converting factor small subunit
VKISVRLFAVPRLWAGREVVELDVPRGTTIGQLREVLSRELPDLRPVLPHVLFAVESQYASNDDPIAADSQIACIPPVSGG